MWRRRYVSYKCLNEWPDIRHIHTYIHTLTHNPIFPQQQQQDGQFQLHITTYRRNEYCRDSSYRRENRTKQNERATFVVALICAVSVWFKLQTKVLQHMSITWHFNSTNQYLGVDGIKMIFFFWNGSLTGMGVCIKRWSYFQFC